MLLLLLLLLLPLLLLLLPLLLLLLGLLRRRPLASPLCPRLLSVGQVQRTKRRLLQLPAVDVPEGHCALRHAL